MCKILKSSIITAGTFILILLLSLPSFAQRNVSYEELAKKNQQPPMFFDFFSLPGGSDNSLTFVSTFSISYNYLPFKRLNNPEKNKQFFSTARLNMEVFKSDPSKIGRENVSVEGLEPASRSAWSDTAYAADYEQTKSEEKFLSGNISVELQPGVYSYMLQLYRANERDGRMSRTRTVRLRPYKEKKYGDILLADSVLENDNRKQLKLLNYGDRVIYGENFYALAQIPRYNESSNYTLLVERVSINRQDTTRIGDEYRRKLDNTHIHTGIRPTLVNNNNSDTRIALENDKNGSAYALVQIPNEKFPNASYRITVREDGTNEPSAKQTVQSIWFNMPTSLFNLDVAIDMLRFIADKSTIREIRKGSSAEREKKFRAFWEKKDPTPETEYNELMAEYYRRIDYAYENFTTLNTVGYESDQGRIYIQYGPPDNIQRKFPTSGTTTEVWTYGSKEFVFRATSGFGDFKLVSD